MAVALLKDADPAKRLWQGSVAAGSSVALTAALVCAATLLFTAGHALLPHTMLDPVHFSTLRLYIGDCQIGLSVAAFIVLWVRLRSVLDLCGHRRTVENDLEAEHSPRPSNRSVLNTVQTRLDFPAMLKSTD